ncbi:MAG: ABC transporter permease [Clostridium sp.]|nr:ABC transporter permease [Clostridium sp.]
MAGFRAAVYKDWKLFLKNAGLLTLVLPFVLLILMRIGMSDLSSAQYIRPFTIAVRDDDGTVMSRSLIEQMKRVEFFDDVMVLTDDDSDDRALSEGAAAVFTIPEDFFYDAYTMEQQPVRVVLSSSRKPEAAVFRMIFTSVMDIMREEQAVQTAVYGFCFPEPDENVINRMHADGSARLLENALRRNNAFARNTSQTDIAGALLRRIAAAAFAFLAVFQTGAVFRSIPEEQRLGIRSRFFAVGGGRAAFFFSRILLLGVILTPAYLAMWLILYTGGAIAPGSAARYAVFCILLTAGVCGMTMGFLNLSEDGSAAARSGSWYLLFSLMLGGTLIPSSSLPAFLHSGVRFMPSGCTMYVLAGLARGLDVPGILRVMGPFLLLSAVFYLMTVLVSLFRRGRSRAGAGRAAGHAPGTFSGAEKESFFLSRFFGMAGMKYRKMTGGIPGLLGLAVISLCAGACVRGAFSGAGETVRIAVTEEEESPEAENFIALLNGMGNIEVIRESAQESSLRLLDGTVEGILTIRDGFSDYIAGTGAAVAGKNGEELHVLAYESAAASFSAQGMREIASGQTMVLRIRNTSDEWAEELLGRSLSTGEREELEKRVRSEERKMVEDSVYYEISWSEGAAAADPFVPQPEAFAALAVLFAVLSSSVWCGKTDNRSAEKRLMSFKGGVALSYGTDFWALILVGFTALAAFGIPWIVKGNVPDIPSCLAGAAYLAVTSLLALFFVRRFGQGGGTDAVTSFLALSLCILGGCFLDLRDTVPVMRTVSTLLPPGLLLYRGHAALPPAIVTAVLLIAGAAPGRIHLHH